MVNAMQYTFSDIDTNNIGALDKYIKTIIVNTKKHYVNDEDAIKSNELFFDDFNRVFSADQVKKYDVLTSVEDYDLTYLLLHLSELERDIIIYNIFEGYKITEIAQIKGLTDKTIRKHRKLALNKLKSYFI